MCPGSGVPQAHGQSDSGRRGSGGSAARPRGRSPLLGDRHRIAAVVDVNLVRNGDGHSKDSNDEDEREQIGLPTAALVGHGRTGERFE